MNINNWNKQIYYGILFSVLYTYSFGLINDVLLTFLLKLQCNIQIVPIVISVIIITFSVLFYRTKAFPKIKIWIVLLVIILTIVTTFFNLPFLLNLQEGELGLSRETQRLVLNYLSKGSIANLGVFFAIAFYKYIKNQRKEQFNDIEHNREKEDNKGIYHGILFYFICSYSYNIISKIITSSVIYLKCSTYLILVLLLLTILTFSILFYKRKEFLKMKIWVILLVVFLSVFLYLDIPKKPNLYDNKTNMKYQITLYTTTCSAIFKVLFISITCFKYSKFNNKRRNNQKKALSSQPQNPTKNEPPIHRQR